ncbi:hypothetical protein DDB_G0291546 [Dictyostelium discoideum AX4]|uniref:Uncharacterized protein n=1 Tax=Dictyostelium discoideum TaxID=44689 RepID=Q54EE6_DICDI|nr:hypothetical protein DDB_G0291546 [Dictyostelium discoideum AX4]EAL61757.1 hypothetical protein DDB_G0291546 [Dictyostelium discoideum AX4]|eukprot:XP_635294.1 hypothetical protein DDB_G0291546 [Dictyostelium discoideum AX4]
MNKLFNNLNKSKLLFINNNFKNSFNNIKKFYNNQSTTTTSTFNNKNTSILFKNKQSQQVFNFSTTNSNLSSSTTISTKTSEMKPETNEFMYIGKRDEFFEKEIFSDFNKSNPNSNYYTFKFQTADATINEKEILESIKNEPKNNFYYQQLGAHIGVNGTTILNGKVVDTLDLYLIQVENNPRERNVFFSLFVYMKEYANLEQVTLLNGETVTLKQCLIKEIANNPNNIESHILLFTLMDHLVEDTVEIFYYVDSLTNEEFKPTFDQLDINIDAEGVTSKMIGEDKVLVKKLRKLDLLSNVMAIDRYNARALDILNFIMMEGNPEIYIGKHLLTTYEVCHNNYIINRDHDPLSIYYYSEQLNPWYAVFITERSDEVSKLSLLVEGINKFPDFPNFYFRLASILNNDYQYVKFKKSSNNHHDDVDGNEEFIEMNRNDLLRTGFNLIKERIEFYSMADLGEYYYEFARYLGLNDTVKFVDLNDTVEKEFTRKQLFIKSIEALEGSFDVPIHELLLLMTPDETVTIYGKPHSIIDVANIPHYSGTVEKVLAIVYKNHNNIDQFKKYNEIYLKKRVKVIENFISAIENSPIVTSNYTALGTIIEKDEKVTINGKPLGRVDLFLCAIQSNPNDTGPYHKLARELPYIDSTITLLDGTIKNKVNLQAETFLYNPHSLYDYATQSIPQFGNFDDAWKSWAMRDCLSKVISMDPLYKNAYLKLAIEMHNYSIDECQIPSLTIGTPFIYFKDQLKLTRKQILIKYLELSQIDFEFDQTDNLLAWYYLSLEMDIKNNIDTIDNVKNKKEEIQFGKTKKQILLSIIEKDETFSRAYSEISSLLPIETRYDHVIEFMVMAIKVESDINIKSSHYYKLSQYLKDNNEKVKLDDGSIMNKQQLLVESIELNPRSNTNNHSFAYHSLANLLTNPTDTIEIFGKQLNQSELFELALINSQNFSDSLKIKSNQILNDTKNLFF